MPGLGPHLVRGTPIVSPLPDGSEQLVVGMGCFRDADWRLVGVALVVMLTLATAVVVGHG